MTVAIALAMSTATATVRSSPPRALDELRALLLSAVVDEPTIDPEQLQVTAVYNSDRHVMGLRVRQDSDDDLMAVLDRVESRLEERGIVALTDGWRVLEPPGAAPG